MATVEYVGRVDFKRSPVERRGMLQLAPGQSPTGYGAKISTDWMVRHNSRWYRVYSVCYSNAASFYILSKGRKLFIQNSRFPV